MAPSGGQPQQCDVHICIVTLFIYTRLRFRSNLVDDTAVSLSTSFFKHSSSEQHCSSNRPPKLPFHIHEVDRRHYLEHYGVIVAKALNFLFASERYFWTPVLNPLASANQLEGGMGVVDGGATFVTYGFRTRSGYVFF